MERREAMLAQSHFISFRQPTATVVFGIRNSPPFDCRLNIAWQTDQGTHLDEKSPARRFVGAAVLAGSVLQAARHLPPCQPAAPTPAPPLICEGDAGYDARGTTMAPVHNALLEQITIDPDVRSANHAFAATITVHEILEWLSSGASPQQILTDYPQLEPNDFLAMRTLTRSNWRGGAQSLRRMKLLFDESLSPRLVPYARSPSGIRERASKRARL